MIIDDIVDNYTPMLDNLDDAIDRTEDEVFHQPTSDTMMRILQLKRNIMTIRRVAVYQREMLNRLSRGEFPLITTDEMLYYRNVYDHLVRMTDMTDSYRDMVSSLLDAYLSVTSNRLNQVMKVLTIISTIFLPLSVITGFFGMNFTHLPDRHLGAWRSRHDRLHAGRCRRRCLSSSAGTTGSDTGRSRCFFRPVWIYWMACRPSLTPERPFPSLTSAAYW